METPKTCFKGPLKNHNFSVLEKLGITNFQHLSGGSDSYYYINENLELGALCSFPEGYILYNENQFFNEWTNYLKEASIPLDKTKIYCHGCPELKQILQQIKDSGVKVNGLDSGADPDAYFAYSVRNSGELGFTIMQPDFYPDRGYKEVTPLQFKEAWIGSSETNEKRLYCRGGEDLKNLFNYLEEHKNIKVFPYTGEDPNRYYWIDKCSVVHANEKIPKEYKLVDCNFFGIYWERHLHDKESVTRPSNDEQAISCKTNPEVQIKLSIKQPLNVII